MDEQEAIAQEFLEQEDVQERAVGELLMEYRIDSCMGTETMPPEVREFAEWLFDNGKI